MKKKKLGTLTVNTIIIEILKPSKLEKQSSRQAEKRICELRARNEADHKMQDRNIALETRKSVLTEEAQ